MAQHLFADGLTAREEHEIKLLFEQRGILFSAAAREDAIKTLLSSDFGEFDPLDYEIYIKNYVNPLANLSLDSSFSNLPGNFSVKETKILSISETF